MRRAAALLVGLAFASVAAADPVVPRPAPNLAWRLADGKTLNLRQYQGKVVALSFLLTTCPHCQNCSRILQKMVKEFGPRGFQALGIAINEMSHLLVEDYMRDLGLSYPVGFLDRDAACEFLQLRPELRMSMPQLVFVDRNGVIRAQYAGDHKFFLDEERNIRAEVGKLLAEGSSGAKPAR
jgi:peroxiredoxin